MKRGIPLPRFLCLHVRAIEDHWARGTLASEVVRPSELDEFSAIAGPMFEAIGTRGSDGAVWIWYDYANRLGRNRGLQRPVSAGRLCMVEFMKPIFRWSFVLGVLLALGWWGARGESQELVTPPQESNVDKATPPLIAPAASTNTGLLLEPPLDLSGFTTEQFAELMATVGQEKIRKEWTSPITHLPTIANAKTPPTEESRPTMQGLSHDEVKAYMRLVQQLFDQGESVPVSDVGLISTQEDVIRRPMLNHISAFANSQVRAYLLVQKTSTDHGWSYFSIVQDLTVDPPLDYYGQIHETEVRFEGTSCYKCHSSGPLAIHPAREDLVLDPKLAAAVSQYIAEQPRSRFYFPDDSPPPATGKPMTPSFCTSCHSEEGDRGPLYQVHSHPIRVLVDFGYMPPDRQLTPAEITELKAWLDDHEQ